MPAKRDDQMKPPATVPAPDETPQRTRSWLNMVLQSVISIAIIGGSVAVLLAIGKGSPPPPKPDVDLTPPVEVQTVALHTGGIDFEVDGVVIPFRAIEVPAEVGGRIAFKSENCRVGHTVKKGELLVLVDPEDYELEVRQIGENVKQARANLTRVECSDHGDGTVKLSWLRKI